MNTFLVFFRFPDRDRPDERKYVFAVPRVGEIVRFVDRKWEVFNVVHEFELAGSPYGNVFVELKVC